MYTARDRGTAAPDALQNAGYFLGGEDHRQAFAAACPHSVQAAEVHFQNLAVQEEQSVQGLILRAGRDTPGDREMGQELLDLGRTQVARVAFVVMEDKTANPLDVALLGARGVMAHAQDLANLIEQAWRSRQGQLAQIEAKDFAIQEVEGGMAAVEGDKGIGLGVGHVFEELEDLGAAEFAWVPPAVEKEVAANPVGEGGNGGFRVAAALGGLTQPVEEARRCGLSRGLRRQRSGRFHSGPPVKRV